IEVETAYGKMQVRRSDILTIRFPENGAPSAAAAAPAPTADAQPAKVDLPKIDESLVGVKYVNRTGGFAMTLPQDWIINPNLRQPPQPPPGLTSQEKMTHIMVTQKQSPGSLKSKKEPTKLTARHILGSFEELASQSVTIDGRPGIFVFYRGVS